jgi:hypothetical protein
MKKQCCYSCSVDTIAQVYSYVRFEVFTAVTMKNAILWDMVLCRSCVVRGVWGTVRLGDGGVKD